MKKTIALILAIVLMLLSFGAIAETETADALPKAGDAVCGFEVLEVRDAPMFRAKIVRFTHQKTGAELYYIANDDTERAFDLTFKTRAVDETGLPHVFEHATLLGSDKYPSKQLFMNVVNQTYSTYLNANTMTNLTRYPIASLSEAQLLKLSEFYTDLCFHPMLMRDESIFRREAWRYRLNSPDDELTLEGTVYSEMKGGLTIGWRALRNALKLSLPGSYYANEFGGDPEHIPEMTYEALCAYHDKYYHPSNCIAYLYGKFDDYTAFLKLLDAEFSRYEKCEIDLSETAYTPNDGPVRAEYAYPVERGSNTENAAYVYYTIRCPGLRDDLRELSVMNTMAALLSDPSSDLYLKVDRALPTASFNCYIDYLGPEDMLVFIAENVDRDDADLFVQLVDTAIAEVAKNGFKRDGVDSLAARVRLQNRLMTEGNTVGVGIIQMLDSAYVSIGDPFAYIEQIAAYDNVTDWNDNGVYSECAEKWLVGNDLTAVAVTCPEPGLKEKKEAELAEKLREIKAGMSEEEKNAIIEASIGTDEDEAASVRTRELLRQLQAVTVDSLPEEYETYAVSDEVHDDGVRYVTAAVEADSVGQPSLYFDLQGIPREDLHWVNLYMSLIGEVDTAQHGYEELTTLILRYLANLTIGVTYSREEEKVHPYLYAGWVALDEDQPQAFDLIRELLFDMKFDDTARLLDCIKAIQTNYKTGFIGSAEKMLEQRATAYHNEVARFENYIEGLDYYEFLVNVEKMFAEDPVGCIAKLESIGADLNNRTNAIVTAVGNDESISVIRQQAAAFMAGLEARPIVPVEYELPVPAAREGLILDVNVQSNVISASYPQLGVEGYSADMAALTGLVKDMFLYPILRDRYGAYSIFSFAYDDSGIDIFTYRDPGVRETFAVYESLPDKIDKMELDRETLDRYIISNYSAFTRPSGPITGAQKAVLNHLNGIDPDQKLENMRAIKSATPEKIKSYADMYRKLAQNGYRGTIGSASVINANADLYDVILNPFGAIDRTGAAFTDVAQGSAFYDEIHYVYENGMMDPVGEDLFGADQDATMGDLCVAVAAMCGQSGLTPEDAYTLLAANSLIPANIDVSAPLSGSDLALLDVIAQMTDISIKSAVTDAATLTRGELAEALCDLGTAIEQKYEAA